MALVCSKNISRHRKTAFSLVELVIVVVIIGVISAIAVPRISQASSSASVAALEATIANVRKAIDRYYAEHQQFPGYDPGTNTAKNEAFVDQLVLYSDATGKTKTTYTTTYKYGPYLRKPFPKNPFNQLSTVFVKANPGDANPAGDAYGWVAVLSTGDFGVIATDQQLDDVGMTDPKRKDDSRRY